MDDKDTVVVVGVTDKDEWGNLWVTPQGGGDKVKIAAKREHLHHLFEQGKAVLLHWEVYKDRPYVAKAEPVEGALPAPNKPYVPDEAGAAKLVADAKAVKDAVIKYAPQELGMWWKELGNRIGDGSLIRDYPKAHIKIEGQYYKKMSEVTSVDFKP